MEHVVLLHGIGANTKTLCALDKNISDAGYITHVIGYNVYGKDLFQIIEDMRKNINRRFSKDDIVHFVGHSLGGIIGRGVMAYGINPVMGKLITLGSPHKGALMGKKFPIGKSLFSGIFGRKIVNDLTYESSICSIPYPNATIGTISGIKRFHIADPVSWFTNKILNEPHDGFISLRSTQIDGVAEGIILDVDHCYMIFDAEVISQTIHFLNNGVFKYESN